MLGEKSVSDLGNHLTVGEICSLCRLRKANVRKFRVWEARPGKKAQGVAGQLFAEDVTCVTLGPTQLCQQEPGVDGGEPGKVCAEASCPVVWSP